MSNILDNLLHVHALELVWWIQANFGFVFTIWALFRAHVVYKATRTSETNQKYIGSAILEGAWIQIVKHSLMAFGTWWAIFTEPPPPSYRELPQSYMWLVVGNAISSVMTYHAIRAHIWWTRIETGRTDGDD